MRGLALLTIYVDHIPSNVLSTLTIGAFGLSDAAEVFVFAAGYSAWLAYGRLFEGRGFRSGLVAVVRRCWRLFTAHVMLVVSLAALVAVASATVTDSDYIQRFNFSPLFVETDIAVPRLATLSYMPNTMDILPLYVVLIGLFPLIWLAIRTSPPLALAASAGLWLATRHFGLNLPDYPERHWFFNPFAWQIMFVLGALAASGWRPMVALARSRAAFWLSVALVAYSFVAAAPWTAIPGLGTMRPVPIETYWMLMEKQGLALPRILHFLALALVLGRLLPARGAWAERGWTRLVILCGQHGLKVFCLGCLLSFASHVAVEVMWNSSVVQVLVSFAGIVILLAVGPLTMRVRSWDKAGAPARPVAAG